jgi:hypothetical protein
VVGGIMPVKYALIKDSKIVKFRNISSNDTLLISKLLSHNYLPVEEQIIPEYDSITQILEGTYEVQENKVLHVWTIQERSFVEAKQMKKDIIAHLTLDEIRVVFGSVDQNSKVEEILNIKDVAIADIDAAENNLDLRSIKLVLPKVEMMEV